MSAALDNEISVLKSQIAIYNADFRIAEGNQKIKLIELLTSSRKTLNKLFG